MMRKQKTPGRVAMYQQVNNADGSRRPLRTSSVVVVLLLLSLVISMEYVLFPAYHGKRLSESLPQSGTALKEYYTYNKNDGAANTASSNAISIASTTSSSSGTDLTTTEDTTASKLELVSHDNTTDVGKDASISIPDDTEITSKKSIATDAVSNKQDLAPHGRLVLAPSDSMEYQDMDATCTLKRYSHLVPKFCDIIGRDNCDLEAFRAYFANHSAKENLMGGCPFADAVCYAKRYTDLLFLQYCNGMDTECDYYKLRQHYEQHGVKERLAWGCDDSFLPLQPAAQVLPQQPALTTDTLLVSSKYDSVIGKASLQVFQGSWEPLEYNQENVPMDSICPHQMKQLNRFCNLTAREDYEPARYVANGLPEWSAKQFKEYMAEDNGSIAFVGDSLMLQFNHELRCLLESENVHVSKLYYHQAFMANPPESVHEQWEVRAFNDKKYRIAFGLGWVDAVIRNEVKYVVYNTGAWWNLHFRERGDWCNYSDWRVSTQEEVMSIYQESMEQTMLPIFKSLVENHGVIPIWSDVPPGGLINLTTGENYGMNGWADKYKMFPRFNEIGRSMMVRAGGWVLPHWDVSFPRSMDHRLHDNPAANDQLHWCALYRNSVPGVWVQLLSQVLFGNDEIKYTNSSNNDNTVSSSLQSIQEETRRAAMEEPGGQDFNSSSSVPFVRLSRSNESPCECADAKSQRQCITNIRCLWSAESEACSERL
jgi:hypothetical protein